jgi:hypothetical protein
MSTMVVRWWDRGHEYEPEVGSSHVLRELKLEILTVRDREVGSSHIVREFEFGILAVGNPNRNDRR